MAEFLAGYGIWAIWAIFGVFLLVLLLTAPCHAVFLLPFVGLPVFWLLPLEYALPVNLVIWLATLLLYRVIRKAMAKPIDDGFHSLVGDMAQVVSGPGTGQSAKYLVRARGELWSAYSTDTLEVGEPVAIVATKGVGLIVERAGPGSGRPNAPHGQ